MASIAPYVFAIILAISTVDALRCYTCNSQDSMSCKWGITSFTYDTQECTSLGILDSVAGPKCFKITAKNKDGDEYIARGCLTPPAIGCSAIASTVGWISDVSSSDPKAVSDLQCVTCDSDKCNSASKIAGFTFMGVLMAVLAFLF